MNYPVIYVEAKDQLISLAEKLGQLPEFALDLEADANLHRYGKKLCLAQIWDGDQCWLIDTTVLDLSILKPVLENSDIIKIMYSASFDASLLADLSGIELKGLFDLQVCSNLLGMGKRSLKHFIKELFDLDLEKDLQTSDWFRRPLTSDQIKYASLDVRYLVEAREIIMPQLEAGDLLETAWDQCHKVEQCRFQEISNPHLRVRNSAHLTPYQKLYLEEYYWLREKIALEWDVPAYRVLRSYQLLHLAKNPLHDINEFEQLEFFVDKLLDYKTDFLEATRIAQKKVLEKNSLVKREILELRHLLHKHPELSGKENSTNKRIHRFVRNFNPTQTFQNMGRTGLAYEFDSQKPGPEVLFRSEIDAIASRESTDISWASREKKVAHLHGNDGHAAILAGLAARLYEIDLKKGKVILVFQPSAENGKGALKLLKEKHFQELKPDFSFSLQNIPGYPENSIIISQKGFTSASTGLVLKLRQESHQNNTTNNIDFSIACGDIISNIPRLCSDGATQSKASIIYIQMGKQNFIKAPDQAEIRIRFLSMNDTYLEKMKESALEYIHGICLQHELEIIHSFTDSFPGLVSSVDALEIIRSVAGKKGHDLIEIDKVFPWSEDFGHYAQISSIAMFGLGAGLNHQPLGSIHYDFPDKLIGPGIDFLTAILDELNMI